MNEAQAPQAPASAVAPLALHVRRAAGPVVGRQVELGAIRQELASARAGRLTALTLEGEPGIGKTRLLVAAAEAAAAEGFMSLAAVADEEIRGPFLLARGIFASPAVRGNGANGAREQFERVIDAISGRDDPTLDALSPDQKLLRVFDLAAVAIRALAESQPVALFVDDLQWADEDSVRMLRYIVRTDSDLPIFLGLATRAEKLAEVSEAVTLIADMERMGMVRRLRLERFTQLETTEFVQQVLGGKVNVSSAATMHAQAEGVAFIVEELARTYREMGMIQEVDGVWTLAQNAARLLPSAVRTLIQRRAARLPDDTKQNLADAAILGRSFSLKDLHSIKVRLGADEEECNADGPRRVAGARRLAGLLTEHPRGIARGLQLHARPGPRVRSRVAHRRAAARDPHGARRHADRRRRPARREHVPARSSRPRGGRRGARSAFLDLGRPGRARCPRGGGGAPHRRPGTAGRFGARRTASRCSPPATKAWACCAAPPTASKASPSWRRWRRLWATLTSSSTSSCAALPRCACPRTRIRPPSWRGRCARPPTRAATARPSWRRAWSWGRT